MAKEIERKFLVINDDWRSEVSRQEYYRQGYLSPGGYTSLNDAAQCSIRVRVANDKAHLNLKSATLGIQRTEYEYAIPVVDANDMLNAFALGAVIEKTRYFVERGGHTWEIDVFEGDNQGLVVAEIELNDEHETFDKPAWLGDEVSDDPRYYNVRLVTHPYKDW